MEEKVLVKSEHYNSIFVWIIPFIAACIVAIRFITWDISISHPIWFIVLGLILLGFIVYWWLSKFELIVTNTRVYGKAAFNKRIDLPMDLVSAVGTSFLWGIDVGTSSGRIHFKFIKNQDVIHSVLNKLLLERQQEKVTANIQTASNADELKKFKDLLDSGAITQAEFEEKKKQLLNL